MADANNAGDNLSTNASEDVNLKPYRELTWEAVALGVVQGIVLNLAPVRWRLKLFHWRLPVSPERFWVLS